jgi:hypothetical protein
MIKQTLLVLTFLCGLTFTSFAQDAPLQNLEGNANSITNKLTKALTLNATQQPKVLNIVTEFLKQRAEILPVANSNPKAYETKMNSLHNGLNRKLKTTLTAEQLAGFEKLKPAEDDKTDVLTQLFY